MTIINLKKEDATMKYEFIAHNPGVDSIESAGADYSYCFFDCGMLDGECHLDYGDPSRQDAFETARMNNLYWNIA